MRTTRTARALLLGMALILPCLPAPAQPQPAEETLASLLRKVRAESSTPAARGVWRAQKLVYTLDVGGLAGTITQYREPGRSRQEVTLGAERRVSADDGATAWVQDASGQVRRESGPEVAENRALSAFSLANDDPTAAGGRLTLRPERDPGTGDYVLDYRSVTGATQTLFVDSHSYRLLKAISRKSHSVRTVEYLSYSRIAGKLVPASFRVTSMSITEKLRLVSAEPEATLDPALFAPPAAARDFAFLTPAGTGPVTLPFDQTRGVILVPVLVNGQKLRLMLDSGASGSLISTDAARKVGLTTGAGGPSLGVGGLVQSRVAAQVTLELPGAVRLTGQTLHVVPLTPDLARVQDGVLGYDLFARFTVTIDYNKKTLTLTDPATAAPQGAVLPLRLDTDSPSIMASVDGRPAAPFLVDTGFSSTVHLFRSYARANGLVPAASAHGARRLRAMGFGGTVVITATPGHRLTVGGLTLTRVLVETGGERGAFDLAGVIGGGVIRKFVVTFDYAHDRLILQKPADFTPAVGG